MQMLVDIPIFLYIITSLITFLESCMYSHLIIRNRKRSSVLDDGDGDDDDD